MDVFNVQTNEHARRVEIHNLFTDVGLGIIRDFLYGDSVTGLLNGYFAMGDGAGTITAASTVLGVERYRDVFVQKTKTGPRQITIKAHLSSTMGNGFTYNKAGLFGNGATVAANSGTMFAALNFAPQAKTTAEAWTFTWVIDVLDDGV
jgi:hypothetical protein